MQNFKVLYPWFLLALVFLAGCSIIQNDTGFLKGKISIGPLCPVETIPPQPECLPTEQTYNAYPVSVYKENSQILVTKFTADAYGAYEIELPLGNYELRSENGLKQFIGTVTIEANKTTALDISIDTGIR